MEYINITLSSWSWVEAWSEWDVYDWPKNFGMHNEHHTMLMGGDLEGMYCNLVPKILKQSTKCRIKLVKWVDQKGVCFLMYTTLISCMYSNFKSYERERHNNSSPSSPFYPQISTLSLKCLLHTLLKSRLRLHCETKDSHFCVNEVNHVSVCPVILNPYLYIRWSEKLVSFIIIITSFKPFF